MSEQVYFIRDPASRRVKIGFSFDLPTRLAFFRRNMPALELLATIDGGRDVEDRFHALLIEHHEGGEWFADHARVEAVVIAVREGWLDISKLPQDGSPIREASAHKAWARRRENGTTGWRLRRQRAA